MLVLFDVSCLAFLFALFLTPLVRNAANRMGLVDKPDATRKFHLGPVPRVGGVGVALAYVLAMGFIYVAPYRNVPFDIPGSVSAAFKLAPADRLAEPPGRDRGRVPLRSGGPGGRGRAPRLRPPADRTGR